MARSHKIVASFTAGGTISAAAFASRLASANTLITDSNNDRIVEVNPYDQVVWSYLTNTQVGDNPSPSPSRAVRLANGETLISDQFNHRVIAVDRIGQIVRKYDASGTAGSGADSVRRALNAPYDAKQIGDYTGLTWSDSLHLAPKH